MRNEKFCINGYRAKERTSDEDSLHVMARGHAHSTGAVLVRLCGVARKKYGVAGIDSIRVSNLGVCRDDTLYVDLWTEMLKRDSFNCIATPHRI